MIIRTWQQACKAAVLDRVIVATDDERIASLCREAGAEVVLTDAECANGGSGWGLGSSAGASCPLR